MSTVKTIVGIRPTGKLHIGHYFSVIKPALEEKADVLIASYHVPKPTKGIYPIPFEMSKALQRYGVKTKIQIFIYGLKFCFNSISLESFGHFKRNWIYSFCWFRDMIRSNQYISFFF